MDDKLKENINNFLMASYDNDMVGMFTALTNFMTYLRCNHALENHLVTIYQPSGYYKLEPHIPREEVVESCRNILKSFGKVQLEQPEDMDVYIKNLYTVLVGIGFSYHMPVEAMNSNARLKLWLTREDSLHILKLDLMSDNWVQEPSNNDYSEFLL